MAFCLVRVDGQPMDIAARVKWAREKSTNPHTGKAYTQQQAAEAAGLHSQTLSRIERGEHVPETDSIRRLAKLYGVTAKWLLDGDAEDPAEKTPVDVYLGRLGETLHRIAARDGLADEDSVRRAAFHVIAIEEGGGTLPGSTPVKTALKPGQRKRPRRSNAG